MTIISIDKLFDVIAKCGKLFTYGAVAGFVIANKASADGPWTGDRNFSSVQGAHQWYYQQRPRGATTPVTNLAWISTGGYSDFGYGSTGYYITGDSHGYIYWHDTSPGDSYDTIRKWIAPSAGKISITGRVFKEDTSGGAGVIASVEKNGSPIWTKTLAYNDAIGYTTDGLINISVASGDSIAFVIDDNGSLGANQPETGWDPVLTTSPSYQSSSDFSSVQGLNQWYYQQRPRGSSSPVSTLAWSSTGGYSDSVYGSTGFYYTADTHGYVYWHDTSPGDSYDTIRKWIAPSAATISITGRVFKEDTSGGAGVIASVEKNGSPIWAKTIAYNNAAGYSTDSDLGAVSVASGDSIAFVVDDNGSLGANQPETGWDPNIAITGSHWVTAWGTAMETGTSALTATNFTTRNIVRVTLPGTAVRIRLSNRFGTAPLTFQQIFVGPSTGGANVSSNTPVYFGGSSSVTVGPGEEIMSDKINLNVTAQEDLAVSIYFSSLNGAGATFHAWSLTTQYNTALDGTGGNHAAETTAGSTYFTGTGLGIISSSTVGWLDSVDVLSSDAAASAVVLVGDSITDGATLSTDVYSRWSDVLGERMVGLGPQTSVINKGISGNGVYIYNPSGGGPVSGRPAIERMDWDVLGLSGVKYCVLFEGTNDISAGASAATLEANLTTIVNQLHAQTPRIQVIGGTILPRGGYSTVRDAVNSWIRTSGVYDGVIDFDPVMADPSNPESLLPAYNSGDGVHPNATGHAAMGNWIDLQLFEIENAISTSVGQDNKPRLLWYKPGGRSVVQTTTQDGTSIVSGTQQSFGPYDSGWLAKNITVGSDNIPHIFWTNNGSWSIWTLNSSDNTYNTSQVFSSGSYSSLSGTGWVPVAMAEDQTDLNLRILVENVNGTVALITLNASNWSTSSVNNYGSYSGWDAVSLSVGADDKPRILWRNRDGHAGIWLINNNGTTNTIGTSYGPFLPSQAISVATGADNVAHVLWNDPSGSTILWNMNTSGVETGSQSYGPYSGDWFGRAVGSGGDSNTRILWAKSDGTLSFWDVDSSFSILYDPNWSAP